MDTANKTKQIITISILFAILVSLESFRAILPVFITGLFPPHFLPIQTNRHVVLLLWYVSVASGVTNYQPSLEDLTDREIANVERIDARDHAMIVHRAFAGDGVPGGSDDSVRFPNQRLNILDSATF